jgi:hypothetical protein
MYLSDGAGSDGGMIEGVEVVVQSFGELLVPDPEDILEGEGPGGIEHGLERLLERRR